MNIEEIKEGLAKFGIRMNDEKAKVVLKAFDIKKNGYVDYNEFLRGIRVRSIRMLKVIFLGRHR